MVGAYHDDSGSNFDNGSAYVFEFKNNSWSQIDKLIASDETSNKLFGHDVSLSAGLTLVGAFQDSENGFAAGAAYINKSGVIFRNSFD